MLYAINSTGSRIAFVDKNGALRLADARSKQHYQDGFSTFRPDSGCEIQSLMITSSPRQVWTKQ